MKIALAITCLTDTLYPATGKAVVTVLERLGCEVIFPAAQTCCGQMHLNAGYAREAARLARRTLDVFNGCDVVVLPSASCTSTIRSHYAQLAERVSDRGLRQGAEGAASRFVEFTELLTDVLGVEDVGARFPHRVAYHPTCHSLRSLSLDDRPQRLLQQVSDLELVELERAWECCGFGGTFAVKNPETSTAMASDKAVDLVASGAEICTATDNSCLMHLGGLLRRQRASVRPLHLAEILAAQ